MDGRVSRDGRGLSKGALPLAAGRRVLRFALTRTGRKVRAGGGFRLELTVTDAAGNVRHVARHVKLRR